MTDAYSEQLVALQEREQELHSVIEVAREAENAALIEHVKTNPTIRPFGDFSSAAWKARRKREKLEKELHAVQEEIPLMLFASVDATREAAVADLAKYAAEVRAVEARQPEIWERLTALYRELLVTYTAENANVRNERRQIDIDAKEKLQNHADLRAKWDDQIYPAEQIRPLPATLRSCLALLESEAFNDPEMTDVLRGIGPFVPSHLESSVA